jgi:hypothetical protein
MTTESPPMAQPAPVELYDQDFYSWSLQQAAALRCAAPLGLNTPEPIDWENLAEEIEDLGKAEADRLESAYRVLLWHLLKYRYQPEHRSGSWRATIVEQRHRILSVLRKNPGLKSQRLDLFAEAYAVARKQAAAETDLPLATFPIDCPFTYEQVVDEDFLPE